MRVAGKHFWTTGDTGTWTMDTGNTNNLRCGMNISGTWVRRPRPNTLPANQWKHIVCAFDGSEVRIYINGQTQSGWGVSASGNLTPKSHNLGIGVSTENANYQNNFEGLIDELKIYDRALSAGEISDSYTGKKSDYPACLPQGRCGDGVKQVPPETCDDGVNNGKYGYCNSTCSGRANVTNVSGYCGNSVKDTGKEVCDSSAMGVKWCAGLNPVTCNIDSDCTFMGTPVGPCVNSGEKYDYTKDLSCTWDCQGLQLLWRW